MLKAIIRKASQVLDDPVLRRWMIGRMLGKYKGAPSYIPHKPPYLADLLPLAPEQPDPQVYFPELNAPPPRAAINLLLPGAEITLGPGEEAGLYSRPYTDTETLLAVHRFAWIPARSNEVDPSWVDAAWTAWIRDHGRPDQSWAWHPYTASERAINILRFARRHGLPGQPDETLACLARHATSIAGQLEYGGEHHTSNHLANNGRGLFLLGLWLGLPQAAEMGGRILREEGRRIFNASGMLREGSSHYHLLLAENYRETAVEAAKYERPEAAELAEICTRADAAAAVLFLPGGLPLIGDISPDRTPQSLCGGSRKTGQEVGARVAVDGWLRMDDDPWSGLWHVSPQGWRHMPGHGHEDCGGFEIHCGQEPLFIDPGRGTYGPAGQGACAGLAHNTLLIDGHDPYPPNRPYYCDSFRQEICGDPPTYGFCNDGVVIRHAGFSRLRGVGSVTRRCGFKAASFSIEDDVEGTGRRTVSRRLTTPHNVRLEGKAVFVQFADHSFRITAEGLTPELAPVTHWTAYGVGLPATQIGFDVSAQLPWRGQIVVEKL